MEFLDLGFNIDPCTSSRSGFHVAQAPSFTITYGAITAMDRGLFSNTTKLLVTFWVKARLYKVTAFGYQEPEECREGNRQP